MPRWTKALASSVKARLSGPPTTVRGQVLDALWFGTDPVKGFPAAQHPVDHQGWNSDHRYLKQAVMEARPRIIVEIGVWKGGSVNTMAEAARELGLDCVVLAVDTWLGSTEHWMDRDLHDQLRIAHGYPRLYHTFIANVIDKGLQDYVVPLPLDSINARHLVHARGIRPDVVHIDAGHDYQSVTADLANWWQILRPGGILVGDDYYTDGIHWQDVRRGFDDFFRKTPHLRFEGGDGKCIVHKPPA